MGVRRLWLLVVVWLIPAVARASDHNGDLFLAASAIDAIGSTIRLGGFQAGGEKTFHTGGHRFSLTGDMSVHFYGKDGDKDLTQITFMIGPRWRFFKGARHNLYFQFMAIGFGYRSDGVTNTGSASGVVGLGAGYDFVKKKCGTWGLRAQFDDILPYAAVQNKKRILRFSVGYVHRFVKSPPTGTTGCTY
jgi:hypothetical protein